MIPYMGRGKGNFINFDEIQMTDTNLQVEGIRSIIDSIQDEDISKNTIKIMN